MTPPHNPQDTNNFSDILSKYMQQVYNDGFFNGFVYGTITTSVLFLIITKNDYHSKIIRV